MIKTILWDIDGTLLDFLASQSAAMKKTYLHFNLGECDDETISEYSRINIKYWEALERGELTKKQVLHGRFEEFLALKGINDIEPSCFCEYYESNLADTIVYIDDSLNLLKSLSPHYKQYAVTNGAYNVQTKKLANAYMTDVFDGIFISDCVGFEKPSKAFFDYVLSHIEACDKEEILIVGDSLSSDMKGGNNIGIKTCWYNPSHAVPPSDIRIDYQISELSQIINIICNRET